MKTNPKIMNKLQKSKEYIMSSFTTSCGLLLRGALSLGLLFLFMTGCKKDKVTGPKYDYSYFTLNYQSSDSTWDAQYDSLLSGAVYNTSTYPYNGRNINVSEFVGDAAFYCISSAMSDIHCVNIQTNSISLSGTINITWGDVHISKITDDNACVTYSSNDTMYMTLYPITGDMYTIKYTHN